MKVMQNTMLADNFHLYEMLITNTQDPVLLSKQKEISQEVYNNLKALSVNLLQKARDILGDAIHITSGYRSDELNKIIGGAVGSQHTKGQAVDCYANDSLKLFKIFEGLDYDQLIWYEEFDGKITYPKWIHVSYSPNKNRKQKLICWISGAKKSYSEFDWKWYEVKK